MLKITELEDLFQGLTAQLLGYSGADANSKVRISWPEEGAPAFKRTDDVTFIQINFVNDDISKQKEITYSDNDEFNVDMKIQYIRPIKVDWVIYGPNCPDNAHSIFGKILLPEAKSIYTDSGLSIIPDYNPPILTREMFNGQWWIRADISIIFNELVTMSDEVPYFTGATFETKY